MKNQISRTQLVTNLLTELAEELGKEMEVFQVQMSDLTTPPFKLEGSDRVYTLFYSPYHKDGALELVPRENVSTAQKISASELNDRFEKLKLASANWSRLFFKRYQLLNSRKEARSVISSQLPKKLPKLTPEFIKELKSSIVQKL